MIDLKKLREDVESVKSAGFLHSALTCDEALELLDQLEAAQKDAARYRYIANAKHAWAVLGDVYDLPAEEHGANNLDESIDIAMSSQA